MPLTKKGKKVKHAFQIEYGKTRGNKIFFKYERKHPYVGLIKKNERRSK